MTARTLTTVSPFALLVDLNIREADLDAPFVENMCANGVIQRSIVHETDGGLRVVMGHRRTLAGVQVWDQEMCVIVTETPEDAERTSAADAASEKTVKEALAARNNAKGAATPDAGRPLTRQWLWTSSSDEYPDSQLE
jgi:hypothetical protein